MLHETSSTFHIGGTTFGGEVEKWWRRSNSYLGLENLSYFE